MMEELIEAIGAEIFKPASKEELADRPPEQFPFPNDVAGNALVEDLVDHVDSRIKDWYTDTETGYGDSMDFSPNSEFRSEILNGFEEQLTALFAVWHKKQQGEHGPEAGV